jgi:DNA polymerase elongation subunit (family B)
LDLQAAEICTLYNTDLSPIQRYFYSKRFKNFGKFTVEYDEKRQVTRLSEKDDSVTPKLNVFQVKPEDVEDTTESKLTDEEFQILVTRKEQRPAIYQILRRQTNSTSHYSRLAPGKLIVDYENFLSLGLAGLDEKSKFANLPIGAIAAWGPARTLDSRQCYEAVSSGILIPSTKAGIGRNILTAKEVAYTDRGALILSPRVGLHQNVGELDFESLFPNILVRHNISYETASPSGISQSKPGFLVKLVEKFIDRRHALKEAKNKFPEDSEEWKDCERRERLLKKLLVSVYGYSGSDLNRFGNIFTYREINRIGRETIISAMNIAMNEGFQIIYLDTDSIFIKNPNATHDDFNQLAKKITKTTGFQIIFANHYRHLILLTQEADPEVEAVRRFYGKLINGKVHYRGIELRRHDYPPYLKHFQEQLLNIILNVEKTEDIQKQQLQKAVEFTFRAVEEVRSGKVPVRDLAISKVLRMPIKEYRSLVPHATAAIQLSQRNKPAKTGDSINYVYVNATHINPMNRVIPAEYAETYDVEKYAEMVLDVAESILGVFKFSRTQLGFQTKPSFLNELRSESMKEILMELENLQT